MEDLWNQKLCPAIISELLEERDNGDVISCDRPGFMQRRTVSCSSAGGAQLGLCSEDNGHKHPSQSLS